MVNSLASRSTATLTQFWKDVLVNRQLLDEFYLETPSFGDVTLRSLHLSRLGPSVILRMDMGRYADRPRQEWIDCGCDRLQLHLQFLDVADLRLESAPLPCVVSLNFERLSLKRLALEIRGSQVDMRFTCSDSVSVGHISAYAATDDLLDAHPHKYVARVDQLLYAEVPGAEVETYHDRV